MIVKILVCRLLVIYVGCASVIHGPTETIGFTSEPSGARLTVSGHHTMTPAYITLKQRGKHIAHFSMERYEPTEFALDEGMSMWFLFDNILLDDIVEMVIDGANGSIGNFSPDNIHVDLVPLRDTYPQWPRAAAGPPTAVPVNAVQSQPPVPLPQGTNPIPPPTVPTIPTETRAALAAPRYAPQPPPAATEPTVSDAEIEELKRKLEKLLRDLDSLK